MPEELNAEQIIELNELSEKVDKILSKSNLRYQLEIKRAGIQFQSTKEQYVKGLISANVPFRKAVKGERESILVAASEGKNALKPYLKQAARKLSSAEISKLDKKEQEVIKALCKRSFVELVQDKLNKERGTSRGI